VALSCVLADVTLVGIRYIDKKVFTVV